MLSGTFSYACAVKNSVPFIYFLSGATFGYGSAGILYGEREKAKIPPGRDIETVSLLAANFKIALVRQLNK